MIFDYLIRTYPGNRFTLEGDNYDGFEWYGDNPDPKPSREEFESNLDYVPPAKTPEEIEAHRLIQEAASARIQYKNNRQMEYPTLQEQLDMQYWDSVNGTTVWQDMIAEIKAKYPKPE
jgi:hypothetical protein